MTIVVTGGSGFIGTALVQTLLAKGHTVIVIDTKGPALTHKDLFYIPCDLSEDTLPFNVLERTDAVIHLANNTPGTISAAHVIASLAQTVNKPSIVVAASTIAYYGPNQHDLDERAGAATTPIAQAINDQEQEIMKAEEFGCRVVLVRTAPVIGPGGGFMKPLLRAARFHFTIPMSKDDFSMPWVHINDLIRIYLFALETSTLQGAVNAVAPRHTTYKEFLRALTRVTRSVILPRLPFIAWPYSKHVRARFEDQTIIPQRLLDKGFAFAYANITEAIADTIRAPQ